VLRLPGSGEQLEMDLLKEALEPSWVTVQITPSAGVRALSLDDTVGLKARAWHDRFVIRDIIDLHGVASAFSYIDLENLARRHDPDLDLEAILDHLAGVSLFPDDDFAEYGLDEPGIADLRGWVTGWYMTISLAVSPRTVATPNSPVTCDRPPHGDVPTPCNTSDVYNLCHCDALDVSWQVELLYFGVTFTIQRLILQARAQRIEGASPQGTGAPTAFR
jgi:hypothetical protein